MRSYYITVGPNPMTDAFIRTGKFEHRHTEIIPCDNEGRYWSDTSASHRIPAVSGNHKKPEKGKERYFTRAFRENGLFNNFSLDF